MANTTQFNHNLVDNDTDLLYKGLGIATIVNQGSVTYVSKNGSDATGLLGRIDRPYLTIQGAINANNAATIVVLGGVYNEQVTLTHENSCVRLLLWHGARIVSDQAYTLSVSMSGFLCEAIGSVHIPPFRFQEGAIINTSATGKCLQYGSNPGHVYQVYKNITFIEDGTGAGACIMDFQMFSSFFNCKFYAAKRVFSGGYGTQIDGFFTDCFFDSQDLLAEHSGYDPLKAKFTNCQFQSPNGFKIIPGGATFKGCTIKTSLGYGFDLSWYSPTYLYLEDTTIVANGKGIQGTLPYRCEINNCKIISSTSMAIDGSLYLYSDPKVEVRNSKILSEASQAYSIKNSNAGQKNINLINCALNKPFNANVDGTIHNVLIDDTLTAL